MRWVGIMLYAVAIPLCYVALLLRSRTAQRSGDGWLVEKLEGEWADAGTSWAPAQARRHPRRPRLSRMHRHPGRAAAALD